MDDWCALGSVLLALAGCGSSYERNSTPSKARLLDACEPSSCAINGSARSVSGITSDSQGFVIGPGPGRLRIDTGESGMQGGGSAMWFVLTEGRGSFQDADETNYEVPSQYAWILVDVGRQGWLTLETSDTHSVVRVADVRYVIHHEDDCRIARGGSASGYVLLLAVLSWLLVKGRTPGLPRARHSRPGSRLP